MAHIVCVPCEFASRACLVNLYRVRGPPYAEGRTGRNLTEAEKALSCYCMDYNDQDDGLASIGHGLEMMKKEFGRVMHVCICGPPGLVLRTAD